LDVCLFARMQSSFRFCVHALSPSIYLDVVDFSALAVKVKKTAQHYGGVTASTEVIAVKRHTGVHASVIACKNTIANQNLAYAA
jgi:hypothetical protein